jgi:hypothetical protein
MVRMAEAILGAAFAAAAAGVLSGCSVGMALSGSPNPDLGAVKTGASRGEIEMHLGSPISSTMIEGGHRADLYQYEIGNEPSAGRAAGHAVMDVLTLCLWEIVGTPVEAVQGDKYTATIEYDENNKVVDLKTMKASSGM